MRIFKKIGRVITAPYCINLLWLSPVCRPVRDMGRRWRWCLRTGTWFDWRESPDTSVTGGSQTGINRQGFNVLLWCHNEHDGVSNHWRLDCLLNLSFRPRSKKHQSPHHWPWWGESAGDRWIPLAKGPVTQKMFHLMTSSYTHNFHQLPFQSYQVWNKICRQDKN